MANTPNYNLWSPDGTDNVGRLKVDLAAMQTSVDTALVELDKTIPGLPVENIAERDAKFPAPVQGNKVFRKDRGWEEIYYSQYNVTTNPGGTSPAGWYPVQPGAVIGLVKRSVGSTITAPNNSYANIGLSSGWTPNSTQGQLAGGVTYNDGFVVPYAGIYRVTTNLSANGRWSAGVNINQTSVTNFQTLYAPTVAPPDIFSGSSTGVVFVPQSGVVRLWAAGLGASITVANQPICSFSIEWVAPARG